ncbi:methyltransferase domain-containing protein [Actinomadura sp. 6N118]|uniref:methyltransferase domain-containing protein n=1 Tax=Actinomadura sp. 6N118 TaxID=3375151 RepID=UPI0037BC4EB8
MLPVPARPPEPSIASLRNSPGDGESLAMYWTFYWAVAAAQLARWLPRRPSRVLDVSGGHSHSGAHAAAAGHTVLEVRDPHLAAAPPVAPVAPAANGNGRHRPPAPRSGHNEHHPPGTLRQIIAETGALPFLSDACVDAVIAEDRTLSRHLATESTIAEIARVLRPGGRVLLTVDSLTLGMALLAEQNCWAHLSDVPSAEVVLVPWPDGTITRCFWADQLRELLTEVGLEVEWIRPRTVLSPSTVEHILTASPRELPRLVRTELSAPLVDESLGIHLLASARRI